MSNHDTGSLGFGIAIKGVETQLFLNYVRGAYVTASTTGSSQLTGEGDGTFLYNITQGVVVVDGTALNIDAAADQACEAAGDILDVGQSIVYLVYAWKHPSTGVVTLAVKAGTAATTGSQVAPTTAEVEAGHIDGAKFVEIGTMTIARTGATAVTEAVDNTVRPLLLVTPNYPS